MLFEDAANAAQGVPFPDFTSIVADTKVNDVLPPSSFGDTTPLSNLRGPLDMGDTNGPGLTRAIACDMKSDPECLAIQMLKYGSSNPQKLDEKEAEKIIRNYGEIETNSGRFWAI